MIRKKENWIESVINLDGPEGNEDALIGYVDSIGRDIGLSGDMTNEIWKKMMCSDYKNLVKTFDDYFGDYVVLETTNEELLND